MPLGDRCHIQVTMDALGLVPVRTTISLSQNSWRSKFNSFSSVTADGSVLGSNRLTLFFYIAPQNLADD